MVIIFSSAGTILDIVCRDILLLSYEIHNKSNTFISSSKQQQQQKKKTNNVQGLSKFNVV